MRTPSQKRQPVPAARVSGCVYFDKKRGAWVAAYRRARGEDWTVLTCFGDASMPLLHAEAMAREFLASI